MLNKNVLLTLGASIFFMSCTGAVELNDEYLKKTNGILNGKMDRTELSFKADGRQGTEAYWIMTKEQFVALKELIEYAVVGYKVVVREDKAKHVTFTNKLGFERNDHFCGIKKAGWIDKLLMCVKSKSISPIMKDSFVHVAAADGYTHVAVKCSLKVNPFKVIDLDSRVYPNVPEVCQVGNLSGIYLRSNGKTTKTGDLTGFSYRAEKNGPVKDYFFGKLWIEAENK